MKINPRLDLFTFELRAKDKSFKTFYEFASNEVENDVLPENCNKTLFNFLMQHLDSDNAKNIKAQKMLCLVERPDKNKHLDKKPNFSEKDDIISGVINGGPFGRDGILMNMNNKEDSETLDRNKTVLSYYYIFLYFPKDYNIGLAMIHSNRMEENLTGVFKEFIRRTFKTENYYSPEIIDYCPKKFQDSFKNNSSIQKITFKQTFIENIHSHDPIISLLSEYDIQIIAIPKKKGILGRNAEKFLNMLKQKEFKSNDKISKKLNKFTNTELTLKDTESNVQRTFEWNARDNDFTPVIYLEGKVEKLNSDGSPDLASLNDFCNNLFWKDIINDIRPDGNVKRVN